MIGAIRLWKEGAIGLLLIALAWATIGKLRAERDQARLASKLTAAQQLIEREREAVRTATALAHAQDKARVARVERDRTRLSLEVERDYQEKLADLRRRHDALRVRNAAARADRGGGGSAHLSGIPGTASDPDGACGEARLPASDALIASRQALQLKALQDWVRAQASVAQ